MSSSWRRVDWTMGPIMLLFDAQGRLVRVGLGVDRPPRASLIGGAETDGVHRAFESYLQGHVRRIDAVCRPVVTEFVGTVIEALHSIPYGATVTYGQLAAMIGRPGASRAVGRALGANPCPVVFPCHRVVAASGLGGFTPGLDWKRALLALEQRAGPIDSSCVALGHAAARPLVAPLGRDPTRSTE